MFTSCVGLSPRPGAQADPYAANGVAGPYNNYTPPAQTSPPAQDPYAAGQYSQGGYNQGGYGTAPVADSGSSGGGYSGGGAAGARSHTVAPGENLTKISRTYNVSIDALVRANNLSSPDQIRSGQKLAIP